MYYIKTILKTQPTTHPRKDYKFPGNIKLRKFCV